MNKGKWTAILCDDFWAQKITTLHFSGHLKSLKFGESPGKGAHLIFLKCDDFGYIAKAFPDVFESDHDIKMPKSSS